MVWLVGVRLTMKSPTCRLAIAVLPVPPFVELTLPVVLVRIPGRVAVTGKLNVHWLPAAILPPESEMALLPVVVSVPPHAVPVPLATVSPFGSTSANATPVSETVLADGLVIVNPRELVPLIVVSDGVNALAITGGATTNKLAEAELPVPP